MKKQLPTLIAFLIMMTMNAQVGVNNTSPEQALDVDGKIKITDDSTDPSAGTMRYDTTSSDFEGYNGSQWNSFTQSKSSGLPSNPQPIYSSSPPISPGNVETLTFKKWDGTVYSSPPIGKVIIITGIYPRTNSYSSTHLNKFYSLAMSSRDGSDNRTGRLSISNYVNETRPINGDQSPLFVLFPGHTFQIESITNSELTMNVEMRGFLVDDLNY